MGESRSGNRQKFVEDYVFLASVCRAGRPAGSSSATRKPCSSPAVYATKSSIWTDQVASKSDRGLPFKGFPAPALGTRDHTHPSSSQAAFNIVPARESGAV